jgi:hypothetical protein
MEIKRQEILERLKRCLPGIDVREGTDFFVIKDGYIYAFNEFMLIAVPFYEGIDCTVRATDFYKLLTKYNDEILNMEFEKESIKIKSKKSKSEIKVVSSIILGKIFAILPSEYYWKPIPVSLIEGIKNSIIPNNLANLRGVFIDKNQVCSTDNKIFCSSIIENEMETVWIRDINAQDLVKFTNIKEYYFYSNWVYFRTEDNIIIACKGLIKENFPKNNLLSILGTYKEKEGTPKGVFSIDISEAIKRNMLFHTLFYKRKTINFTFVEEGIIFHSENELGNNSELIEINGSDKWGKDYFKTFSIDATLLLNIKPDGYEFNLLENEGRFVLLVSNKNSKFYFVLLEK